MNSDYNNVRMMSDTVGCLYNIISQVAQVELEDMSDFMEINFRITFPLRGCAKKKMPKIRDYDGTGWVGRGLTQIFFGKIIPKQL